MHGETKNQFSLTRAALSTGGRAMAKSLTACPCVGGRKLTWNRLWLSILCVRYADLTITELTRSTPKAVRETEAMGIRGIIRNGKAVAFLVSRSVMESILETMELQKDRRLMAQIRAHKAGKLKLTPLRDEEG